MAIHRVHQPTNDSSRSDQLLRHPLGMQIWSLQTRLWTKLVAAAGEGLPLYSCRPRDSTNTTTTRQITRNYDSLVSRDSVPPRLILFSVTRGAPNSTFFFRCSALESPFRGLRTKKAFPGRREAFQVGAKQQSIAERKKSVANPRAERALAFDSEGGAISLPPPFGGRTGPMSTRQSTVHQRGRCN